MLRLYCNNAATSWPKPNVVMQAMAEAFTRMPATANRASYDPESIDVFQSCRLLLAKMLGIGVDGCSRLVFTENATKAVNIALLGFPWKNDARVLVDGAAHNSVLRPLHYLQGKGVLKYHVLALDSVGRVDESLFCRALKDFYPQMVLLTHASNVTGVVNDVQRLFDEAKKIKAVTFLDVAQTLGLLDIDVLGMQVDLMAFTGHKYLLGPQGTGGLYIAPNIEVQPTFTGGTGVRSDILDMPPEMPMRLENGTPNDLAFAGLLAALQWHAANGAEAKEQLQQSFCRLREGLKESGTNIIDVGQNTTPIVSFLPNSRWSVEEVGQILEQSFGVVCRTGLHCAPLVHRYIGSAPKGTVRLSISSFTKAQDVDYVCSAVQKFC